MKKVFFASIFLLCFYSLSYSALDDLLAYWSFDDGTACDVTGNSYDGVKMNNPTVVPGVVGNALHFQGKGYYMLANNTPANIGDHILLPSIDLHKFEEFTISMWVYEEDFSEELRNYVADENSKLIIISKQNSSANVEIFDLLGRRIYNTIMWLNIGENLIEIWEYLNRGLYIVLVKRGNGVLCRKMIVK